MLQRSRVALSCTPGALIKYAGDCDRPKRRPKPETHLSCRRKRSRSSGQNSGPQGGEVASEESRMKIASDHRGSWGMLLAVEITRTCCSNVDGECVGVLLINKRRLTCKPGSQVDEAGTVRLMHAAWKELSMSGRIHTTCMKTQTISRGRSHKRIN